MLFHIIQSAVRIVMNREMILKISWFPLDTSAISVYIFVNITQVQSTA